MNRQNSGAAEGKKPKGGGWQGIVIAIVAVACMVLSTVIVARGVDSASAPSQTRHPGSRASHHSVTSALTAAAHEVNLDKLRQETCYIANGLSYPFNVSSFPSISTVVAGAKRPFVALFRPILRSRR